MMKITLENEAITCPEGTTLFELSQKCIMRCRRGAILNFVR